MKTFLFAIVVALVGCDDANKPTSGQRAFGVEVFITTHEHDGHKWVSATSSQGSISLTHHPDCKCRLPLEKR